jgi:hypothetical protein
MTLSDELVKALSKLLGCDPDVVREAHQLISSAWFEWRLRQEALLKGAQDRVRGIVHAGNLALLK